MVLRTGYAEKSHFLVGMLCLKKKKSQNVLIICIIKAFIVSFLSAATLRMQKPYGNAPHLPKIGEKSSQRLFVWQRAAVAG